MVTRRFASPVFAFLDFRMTNRVRLGRSPAGLAIPIGSLLVMLFYAATVAAQSLDKNVGLTPNAGNNGITAFNGAVNGLGKFTLAVLLSDQALGNKAFITYFAPATGETYNFKPIKWYDGKTMLWLPVAPAVKVDPTGYPAGQSPVVLLCRAGISRAARQWMAAPPAIQAHTASS
jgi:hypothetical protein